MDKKDIQNLTTGLTLINKKDFSGYNIICIFVYEK